MPRMTVSRLLKSCAMPPVSWPTASIFWALAQLLLQADARGDVGLGADEMRQPPRLVVDGRDAELVGESGPVPAVVGDRALEVATFGDRAPHLLRDRALGPGALQEAAVAAENVAGGVARETLEGRVDVDDRMPLLGRVRDDHAVARRGERTVVQAQHLLRGALRGDVAEEDGDALVRREGVDLVPVAERFVEDLERALAALRHRGVIGRPERAPGRPPGRLPRDCGRSGRGPRRSPRPRGGSGR